jgi:hypothetical protein
MDGQHGMRSAPKCKNVSFRLPSSGAARGLATLVNALTVDKGVEYPHLFQFIRRDCQDIAVDDDKVGELPHFQRASP